MSDLVLFVAFPYVAILLAVVVGVYRYFDNRFTYSSLSSQFLENRQLFWGSVPWHYGITFILLAHLLALLFPRGWSALLGGGRLYVLEITGWGLALMTIVGAVMFIVRRLGNARVRAVTTWVDWLLLIVLVAQVVSGFWVAFFYRWGGVWYVHTAVPWLVSLLTLNPQPQYVATLPLIPKLHVLGGFLIIALFPFTRLVHLVSFPITYLWRPYQVVIWNRRPRRAA